MHVIDIIVNNYYTTNSHFAWADQTRAYTGSTGKRTTTAGNKK